MSYLVECLECDYYWEESFCPYKCPKCGSTNLLEESDSENEDFYDDRDTEYPYNDE